MSEVEKVWNKVLPMLQKAAAKDARRAASNILRKEGGPLVTLLLGKGKAADAKPCPVTGVMNTHRRYSYLMPEVRTAENLAKFKKKILPAKKSTKKGAK